LTYCCNVGEHELTRKGPRFRHGSQLRY
jgi:hypothetical protein